MPPLPTKPRAALWLMTASLPLVFASGCPQLASDFTKNDVAVDSDGGGANGGGSGGTDGGGGTIPNIDLSNATSSGGSENSASTSQGGTDAADAGVTNTTEADASTSTDGEATASASTNETTETVTTGATSTDGVDAMPPACTPENEVCDGLDNDCDTREDEDEVCGWSCDGFAIADHGYMFCANPMPVAEAASECDAQGMTLVQIDSADENEALVTEADLRWEAGTGSFGGTRGGQQGEGQQPAFWTGGSDAESEGDWRWTGSGVAFWEGDDDGIAVAGAYANWGEGRPNDDNDTPENCAAVYVREGADGAIETWNDLPCTHSYPFICESP